MIVTSAKVRQNFELPHIICCYFQTKKDSIFELSFFVEGVSITPLHFLVFIVCEMIYQPAFFEFPNVFLGGFVGNIEALSGFQVFLP